MSNKVLLDEDIALEVQAGNLDEVGGCIQQLFRDIENLKAMVIESRKLAASADHAAKKKSGLSVGVRGQDG